jgi:hypothetical protein
MRKRLYTRNVGVLLTDDDYQKLVNITDELQVTISKYIRDLVLNELREKENKKNV